MMLQNPFRYTDGREGEPRQCRRPAIGGTDLCSHHHPDSKRAVLQHRRQDLLAQLSAVEQQLAAL